MGWYHPYQDGSAYLNLPRLETPQPFPEVCFHGGSQVDNGTNLHNLVVSLASQQPRVLIIIDIVSQHLP